MSLVDFYFMYFLITGAELQSKKCGAPFFHSTHSVLENVNVKVHKGNLNLSLEFPNNSSAGEH